MNTNGFTLIQTVTTLAVISIIATLGTVSYYKMIQKSQIAEASNLIANQQIELFKSFEEGKCATTPVQGKYGIIQGQGDYSYNNGSSCSSGCELKYQFNSNGVSPKLKGKVITVSLLNNGKVSLVSGATTVPEQYLSGIVTSTSSISGDSCSAKIPTQPTITDGSVSGVEVGDTAPTTPVESSGSFPSDPSLGGGGTAETTTPESTIDLSDPKNQPSNLVCHTNTIGDGGSSSWVSFCVVVNKDATLEFGQALTAAALIHDLGSVITPSTAMAHYIKKYRKCPKTDPSDKLVWTSRYAYFGIINEFLAKQPYVISPQPVFYRVKDDRAMLDAVQVAREENPRFRLSSGNGVKSVCISGYVKPIPKR